MRVVFDALDAFCRTWRCWKLFSGVSCQLPHTCSPHLRKSLREVEGGPSGERAFLPTRFLSFPSNKRFLALKVTDYELLRQQGQGEHLREAMDSVFWQSWPDWEIVFWDNCSTDDSAAIASRATARRCSSISSLRRRFRLGPRGPAPLLQPRGPLAGVSGL